MEAKRVVFVSLKPSSSDADAGTSRGNRRKRALGIEENATWEEFTAAVCARLQIAGLRAVYHASTGERVQGVGDVQDIEDLVVEEDESVRTELILSLIHISEPTRPERIADGGVGV